MILESPTPIVEGGLLLRPLEPRDADPLAALLRDPDCATFGDFAAGGAVTADDVADLIASTPEHAVAVADAGRRDFVGAGGLRNLDRRRGISDFWFALLPQHRGRGLAAPGLRLFGHWAAGLGLARLQGYVLPENVKIQRALDRAGFTREGVLRSLPRDTGGRADLVIYSLLRDELRDAPVGAPRHRTRRPRRLSLPRRTERVQATGVDHVRVLVSDLERSREFYDLALAPLGLRILSTREPGVAVAAPGRPAIVLVEQPERGSHAALTAANRAIVHEFYEAALAAGGTPLSPPQAHPTYHRGYYGAIVRDPDGAWLEAVCHST